MDEQPKYPVPPPVSVHFVIDPNEARTFIAAVTLDEPYAHKHAREIGAVVVSMPVSGDYRPKPEPVQAEGDSVMGEE